MCPRGRQLARDLLSVSLAVVVGLGIIRLLAVSEAARLWGLLAAGLGITYIVWAAAPQPDEVTGAQHPRTDLSSPQRCSSHL
jgi:hypothetical protein